MQPDVIVLYIPELRYSSHGCARTRPDLRALYATVSSEQNVPFVDPGEAFCAEFERTGQPLHGFQNSHLGTGHINARGHALVSDLLAQVIRTRLP
jgi:hypothetical protein